MSKSNAKLLPTSVSPLNYTLSIKPDMEKFTYIGSEEIFIKVHEKTSTITMNSLDLNIDSSTIQIENNNATIGITDYAQSELGDIIFIEFPDIGTDCNVGDTIGTIEAVKTVADLFSPIEGQIVEINNKLEDDYEVFNLID